MTGKMWAMITPLTSTYSVEITLIGGLEQILALRVYLCATTPPAFEMGDIVSFYFTNCVKLNERNAGCVHHERRQRRRRLRRRRRRARPNAMAAKRAAPPPWPRKQPGDAGVA